jgi:UDP-N-acetylmuramoyl-L-alanyl-D-glutamate--2,6-diaminopimelate ligase
VANAQVLATQRNHRSGTEAETLGAQHRRFDDIEAAVDWGRPGDVVVIAGKGHETYQIIGARSHDFDDREVARAALRARGGPGGQAWLR